MTTRAICLTIPYQNHWNMSYDCEEQFPWQFRIKIIEIWPMTAKGNFLHNSLSKSLKYDPWQLWTLCITIPYQNHWNMTYDCYGPFPVKFLIKSMRYETWLLRTISFTTPYQNPCNMTYDCSGPLPIQFLIKCIEIWDLVARGNFLYNSLSKSLKYDLWLLRAISFTTPYQNHCNITHGC